MTPTQLFEFALSLSETEKAELVFQLLQSLSHPAEKMNAIDFGVELQDRIDAHRRGELQSFSVAETRAKVRERLLQART